MTVAVAICPLAGAGETRFRGPATVIDGDTIHVAGRRVRLAGMDAFEHGQRCRDGAPCGRIATVELKSLIDGRPVACESQSKDRYGRTIATCRTEAGEDLGGWMVTNGHALAYRKYSKKYVAEEEAAREAGAGAWARGFDAPWLYRRGARK